MVLVEFLRTATRILLLVTFAVTLVDLARQRDRLRLEIALLFLSLTATILSSSLEAVGIALPETVSLITTLALISHPYIFLRLVDRLRPVPQVIHYGAAVALAAAGIVVLAFPRELPPPAVISVVLYFVLLEAYSASLLLWGARSLSGETRIRMILGAGGAGLLSAAILTAGLSTMLSIPEDLSDLGVQGFAALSALGLYFSFAPPAWFRQAWRLFELQRFITSAAESEPGDPLDRVLRLLESSASSSMGAALTLIAHKSETPGGDEALTLPSGETLALDSGPLAEAWQRQQATVFRDMTSLEAPLSEIADRTRARAIFFAPIQAAGRPWGALLSFRQEQPIFPDDDLAFLSMLVEQAEYRIAQALLLAQQKELVEELSVRTAELARKELYVEEMQDPLWVLDENGHTEDLNPALERLTGYSADELIGRHVFEFFDEENRHILEREFEKRERGESSRYEIEVRAKDGTSIPVIITGSPVVEAGEIVGKLGVLKDIRSQKASERRLEAANRELEAFAYSVSHDLRAPLRAIDGFSRILVREHREQLPDRGRNLLDRIRHNTQQMGQLIDDLLAYSRIGRQEVDRQSVDPTSVVREALEDLEAELEGRDVKINVEDLPPARADRRLLKAVFDNLLSNAIKYTRERDPGVIAVGSEPTEDGPVYFVRDNGVGFDMQYADKLFGVFQRLHRAEEYEGTGVGLATVQRIIHQHGGRIWAESEVDGGATFRFTLGEESHDEHTH